MASRIIWTDSAWRELEHTANYIAQDSPKYASAFVDEVRAVTRSLRRFPKRGRVVPEVGVDTVRELFVKRYRLIYELRQNEILVLALIHGARRFPTDLV